MIQTTFKLMSISIFIDYTYKPKQLTNHNFSVHKIHNTVFTDKFWKKTYRRLWSSSISDWKLPNARIC